MIWLLLMALMTAQAAHTPAPHLDFEARGAIQSFWGCKAPEVLVEGPAGTGKSRGILERLYHECETYPGLRVMLGRKTRATLAESALVTWEEHVLPPGHECRDNVQRTGRHKPYQFANGSVVVPFGFDDREKIKSTEFDRIYVNEATEITLEDWEFAISRLRGIACPWSQAIADCNPGAPNHWLNRRPEKQRMSVTGKVQMNKLGTPMPMMKRFISRHQDNPLLWDARKNDWTRFGRNYISKLQNLTGTRRSRLLLGLWVAAEGAVFEESWDPAKHVLHIQPQAIKARGYVASVDWGFKNPFVMQVWAVNADGTMYRIREIYHSLKSPDWCRAQAQWIKRFYGNIEFICDPENASEIDGWRKAGLRAVEADKARGSIIKGIHDIEDRLRPDDGPPSLYLLANATGWYDDAGNWVTGRDEALAAVDHPVCTEEEFVLYTYAKTNEGKPIKEQPPIDMYDHGIDATRYAETYISGRRGSIGARPMLPTMPSGLEEYM